MNQEFHDIEITPIKKLWHQNDYGIYACTSAIEEIKLNAKNNFVISGKMPELLLKITYKATIKETTHPKHGISYQLISIKRELPTNNESQHQYIRSIITQSIADAIIEKYPAHDIIGMIRNDSLDYHKIKGVGTKTYQKIKNKILSNYDMQEALVEFSQFGVSYVMIKRILNHYQLTVPKLIENVKLNPYCLLEVDGLGFIKVDQYAQKMGIDANSPHRINAAVQYLLTKFEQDGHSWVSLNHMLKELDKSLHMSPSLLFQHLDQVVLGNYIIDQQKRIALKKNIHHEQVIASHMKKLLSQKITSISDIHEHRILQAEKLQGFTFTEEQKKAIHLSIQHPVVVISGRAGVGKSTVIKGIIHALSDLKYQTCAFSGKAVQRIIESTSLTSKTIHRLLEAHPYHDFTYNENNPLNIDIVILDEASMVNAELFSQLISAIPEGAKFIICGDTEQLPAIGAGNVLLDLIKSGLVPTIELTTVHRQALKSGILYCANRIRDGHQITRKNQTGMQILGELQDMNICILFDDEMFNQSYSPIFCDHIEDISQKIAENENQIFKAIIDYCDKHHTKYDLLDFQIILPLRNRGILCTKNMNKRLQEIFNPGEKEHLNKNGFIFKPGDKIIKKGNDKKNQIYNGTLGYIEEIDPIDQLATISFLGASDTLVYNTEDLNTIDLAYALTVHATQGSQFEHVIIGIDYSAYTLLSRQLIYTAITRASKQCTLFCNNAALQFSIRQNFSKKRNTFLNEFLLEQ